MARLVFGMNQSLDGYVDHTAFAPGPTLFRHFIKEAEGQAGSMYGHQMYEVMRYWDDDQPSWGADERAFDPARDLRTAVRRVDIEVHSEALRSTATQLFECPPIHAPLFSSYGEMLMGSTHGASAAIFRSGDKGVSWEKITDNLKGGVMHMCPAPDGNGMIAGTSDGSLLAIDESGVREIVSGLPFVTSVELAA